MQSPKAFISYSWDDDDHKKWVANLAASLRGDGVETRLDQWHAVLGDQLPKFMETEIRENNYVLIICTPNYREKADQRMGGVGYEGDIMTAEVHTQNNHRKFIPILARGDWTSSAPSWLAGKYYVDLSSIEKYDESYSDLLTTLLGKRVQAPVVKTDSSSQLKTLTVASQSPTAPIQILGIITDEVTEPQRDGTRGSALYSIPFQLSRSPSSDWENIFVDLWNRPPRFTSMHRPRIASVHGDIIILNGTTIEEVKRYHRDTLVLCVQEANRREQEFIEHMQKKKVAQQRRSEVHRQSIENHSRDIDF